MKAFKLLLFFLFPALLFAQDTLKTDEVPETVRKMFERRNRGVKQIVWVEKVTQKKPLKKVQYIAIFENNKGSKLKKYFDQSGDMIKTVQEMEEDDLRESILDYIDENYDDYEIQDITYVEKGRRKQYYSIIMHHDDADNPPDTEVRFDQRGNFLSISDMYVTEDMDAKYHSALKKSEVPDVVLESFERRNRNAGQTIWTRDGENYVVTYTNRYKKEVEKYYTEEGELIKTVQKEDLDEIRSSMLEYIDDNYGKYRPYEAYYVEKGRRDRYYKILMHHKKADDPPETEIQFDQSGNFITIFNLYIPEDEDKEEEEIDEDFAEELDEDADELAQRVNEKEVKKKELPTSALKYINDNYPYPFRMKKAQLKNSSRGPIYDVKMKQQGEDFFIRLKFTNNGKIFSDKKIEED